MFPVPILISETSHVHRAAPEAGDSTHCSHMNTDEQVLLRPWPVTWAREAICVQVLWAGLAR